MNWLDAADVLFGVYIGIYYTMNFYKPVLPVKVTKLPPEIEVAPCRVWQTAIEPFVRNFLVTEHFASRAMVTPEGAKSIRLAMQMMAKKLDEAHDKGLVDKNPNVTIKVPSAP